MAERQCISVRGGRLVGLTRDSDNPTRGGMGCDVTGRDLVSAGIVKKSMEDNEGWFLVFH